MKKTLTVTVSALLLVCSGCSDAHVKLKDSNEVLMSVGKTNITKGEVFSSMSGADGAYAAVSGATKIICDAEVPVTDDMKKQAQESLDSSKAMYGEDYFNSYLEQSGMTEEEYLNSVLIPSLQAAELPKNFVTENFDNLVAEYQPVKAIVLTFSSEADMNEALSALNDGSKNAEEISNQYSLTESGLAKLFTIEDTSYGTEVTSIIRSVNPDEGWKTAVSNTGSFYLIKVTDNNAAEMQDEIKTAFAGIQSVSKEASTYYFKKYGFHVYDKGIYDDLQSNYSEFLVQDMKDDAEATK